MNQIEKTTRVFDSCAKAYQEKYMNISLYKESLDLFIAAVKKDRAAILEIGCGPGNITNYVLSQAPHYSILSTDISTNMLKLARKNVPKATFTELDGRNISRINGEFNGIICGFCYPYFSKEEVIQNIKDAANLLETEGILYISTIEGLNSDSKITKSSTAEQTLFINYHEFDYINQAIEDAGLFLLKTQRVQYVTKGEEVTDLIVIAKKQV